MGRAGIGEEGVSDGLSGWWRKGGVISTGCDEEEEEVGLFDRSAERGCLGVGDLCFGLQQFDTRSSCQEKPS